MEEKASIKAKLNSYTAPQDMGMPRMRPKQIERFEAVQNIRARRTKPKGFVLPGMSKSRDKITPFLQGNGIDAGIIEHMADSHYIFEAQDGACVFVGYDEDTAKYAIVCGTDEDDKAPVFVEIPGSHKFVAWPCPANGESELLQVFEHPIGALQKMSEEKGAGIAWDGKHHLAVGGFRIEPIYYFTRNHPEITTIAFCFGDDVAGRSIAKEYAAAFRSRGMTCYIEVMKKE